MINSCNTPSERNELSENLEYNSFESAMKKILTIEISDTGAGMTDEVK